MIKPRRIVWLVMIVLTPVALLLALYGMAGYAMNASMSVASNMDPARAVALARVWLLVIGCSLAFFVAGALVLWRWRSGA